MKSKERPLWLQSTTLMKWNKWRIQHKVNRFETFQLKKQERMHWLHHVSHLCRRFQICYVFLSPRNKPINKTTAGAGWCYPKWRLYTGEASTGWGVLSLSQTAWIFYHCVEGGRTLAGYMDHVCLLLATLCCLAKYKLTLENRRRQRRL